MGRRALFEQALRSLDRADKARRLLNTQGLVTVTEKSGVAPLNPLLKAETDARRMFQAAWQQLGLAYSGYQPPTSDFDFEGR